MLVAVITPRYLKSEWCLKELTEFCRRRLEMGDRSFAARIFKVFKTPTQQQLMTGSQALMLSVGAQSVGELIERARGYDFFEMTPAGRSREFSQEFGPETGQQFWLRLDDIAHDIAAVLQKTRTVGTNTTRTDQAPGPADVYLAETTADLTFQRDAIKRELQRGGYRVVPDLPLPTDADALREAIETYLETSRLSIHLIGGLYGSIPNGDTRSTGEIQAELAAERSHFARIIWMPGGLQSEDSRQREFVARLRQGVQTPRTADLRDELLEGPLETLKTFLQETLTRAPGTTPVVTTDDILRIYLVCDRQDMESVRPIEDALFEVGRVIVPCSRVMPRKWPRRIARTFFVRWSAHLLWPGQRTLASREIRDVAKVVGWVVSTDPCKGSGHRRS